jgi:proline dehydrogenase
MPSDENRASQASPRPGARCSQVCPRCQSCDEVSAAWHDPGIVSVSRRVLVALATSERLERAVCGLPGGERAAYTRARRYVAGRERTDAFAVAHELARDGLSCSVDFFGEGVSDPVEADRVTEAYARLAGALDQAPPATFLSLDLSHIGIDQPGHSASQRFGRIAQALPAGSRIQVGAEQAARADRIVEAVITVARAGLPVSATVQANLKRSPADAARLRDAGVPIRLVKGAYVEDPAVAHAWGEPTNLAFLELAYELHRSGAELSLGTHDPVLRDALLLALRDVGVEMLLGVRPDDARAIAAERNPANPVRPHCSTHRTARASSSSPRRPVPLITQPGTTTSAPTPTRSRPRSGESASPSGHAWLRSQSAANSGRA